MSDRQHAISLEQLRESVARGIITAEQFQALCALEANAGAAADSASHASAARAEPEAVRNLNVVTLAYALGAGAVLFALGWYIIDRWNALGPAGILAVCLAYVALFVLTSRVVNRMGFQTAAAIAALLAVSMTPVIVWSLLKLTGWWYPRTDITPAPRWIYNDVLASLRWIPIELATMLAALLTLRRVKFGLLALPVALPVPLIVNNAAPLFFDPQLVDLMRGWVAFVTAMVLIAAGYVIERHKRDDEDYARWVYLTGLLTLAVSVLDVWDWAGALRHGMPILAVALLTLSLYLRRTVFVVFGALGVIEYFEFLAFDVFRTVLSFPVVLASFGIAVIVVAVWAQRRYPVLVRRMEARHGESRAVPYAALAFGGAIVVALGLAATRVPAARAHVADTYARQHQEAIRAHAQRQRLRADSVARHPAPPR